MNCTNCNKPMREIALFTSTDWHCDGCDLGSEGETYDPSKVVLKFGDTKITDFYDRCRVFSPKWAYYETGPEKYPTRDPEITNYFYRKKVEISPKDEPKPQKPRATFVTLDGHVWTQEVDQGALYYSVYTFCPPQSAIYFAFDVWDACYIQCGEVTRQQENEMRGAFLDYRRNGMIDNPPPWLDHALREGQ